MPGVLAVVPGVLAVVPGVLAVVPGVLAVVPGVLAVVPGVLAVVPGVLAVVPGVLAVVPGVLAVVPGVLAVVPGVLAVVPGVLPSQASDCVSQWCVTHATAADMCTFQLIQISAGWVNNMRVCNCGICSTFVQHTRCGFLVNTKHIHSQYECRQVRILATYPVYAIIPVAGVVSRVMHSSAVQ